MSRKILVVIIVFTGFLAALFAEPAAPSTLEELAALAAANNLDLKESLWELEKARSALPGTWGFTSSTLTLKGEAAGAGENFTPSVSAGLTVPVTDQVRLTGTIEADRSGEAGISLFPLAHSDETTQARLSLTLQEQKAVEKKIEAENTALGAVLTWMSSRESLEIQESLTVLREQEYRDARVRYEAGEVVLDEIRRLLQVWSEAQSLLVSRQVQEQADLAALRDALGREDISLPSLSTADLEAEILRLQGTLTPGEAAAEASGAVRESFITRESLAAALKNTWAFSPTLQADLEMGWDGGGEPALGLSVSFNFSLEDFQGDRREELKGDLALEEARAEQTLRQEEQMLQQVLLSLDTARLNREVAQLAREEAGQLAEESELLYSLGEYSALEREEALLDRRVAELTYFQALTDQYMAWLNLRVYLY